MSRQQPLQPFTVNADFALDYVIIERFLVFNKRFQTILYYRNEI